MERANGLGRSSFAKTLSLIFFCIIFFIFTVSKVSHYKVLHQHLEKHEVHESKRGKRADPKLVNYIHVHIGRGISDKQLKNTLVGVGWPEKVVDREIRKARRVMAAKGWRRR